jgi:hypothetical protein
MVPQSIANRSNPMTQKVLLLGGSLNQTRMMHKIASEMEDVDCFFTPYYTEGFLKILQRRGLLDFTILGGRHREATLKYFEDNNLLLDNEGKANDYDLVVTCTDGIIQPNIRNKRLLLVQEGMMDSIDFTFHLVKHLKLPRWLANTSTTGLSDAYDVFCVASKGYRDWFVERGVNPSKILITGIPNFDNVEQFQDTAFPLRNYVLVATSNARETFKRDKRMKFIRGVKRIANGRTIIYKLHPNENVKRARREILSITPDAMILTDGNVDVMIAHCEVLITQYSSVTFTGLALGKEVHSYLDIEELGRLLPIQNGGSSAKKIAEVCFRLLHTPMSEIERLRQTGPQLRPSWLPADAV